MPLTPAAVGLLRELVHRLRGPLATVHGYASLIEAHAAGNDRLAEWAQRIQAETERTSGLLGDLSRLRSVLAGGVRREPLDLFHLAREAVQQAESDLERPVGFLSDAADGSPLPALGDADLLRRSLYHLILVGARCGSSTSLRLLRRPDGAAACHVEWAAGSDWSPRHDPWLLFCEAVAAGHGGRLEVAEDHLTLTLQSV